MKLPTFETVRETTVKAINYVLSWIWVKHFLYWLFVSAGTVSECAFLIASIWMSVNSSVHPMILTVMSEQQSVQFSYIASTIFTAIPEMILGLALLTTIEHCKNIRRQKQHWHTCVWPILFGLPTIVFLFISVLTVSCSVLKVNYVMPDWGIVARALSGYLFVIVSFLYERIGEPCYASERKGLEEKVNSLQAEIERLVAGHSIEKQTLAETHLKEVENLTLLLKTSTSQVNLLAEKASSLELRGLDSYPKVTSEWIERGVKTVTLNEIEAITGLSRQRINAAAKADKFQRDNRNKDKVRVSSVIEWLKTIPAPTIETSQSNGHSITSENETPPFGLPVFSINGSIE